MLDGFSQRPDTEIEVSAPISEEMLALPLDKQAWPEECTPILKESSAATLGELVEYLNHCTATGKKLNVSEDAAAAMFPALITFCYDAADMNGKRFFWEYILESNSLVLRMPNDPAGAALRKMRVEQSAYCLWLTAQPPEEILHHAYEYSVREDIILATEEMNLTPAQVRALLKSPAPLADVYKDFSKLETDYMSIVAQCVEDRADDLLKRNSSRTHPKYIDSPSLMPANTANCSSTMRLVT